MKKQTLILGIETSCDETSAAVVGDGVNVLSNTLVSQAELHQQFGGVVPEVASRKHVEFITYVIEKALKEARVSLEDISAIAVTQGPGLVGALLIGVMAAKGICFSRGIPLIGVHHIAGHIYANQLIAPLKFPLIAAIISGGHTELIYMEQHSQFKKIGQTRDDAAGEAFDKVARLLGLGYPGGPFIDRLALQGEDNIPFPRAWLEKDSLDFSFSGLKSAVVYYYLKLNDSEQSKRKADIAASFQAAVCDLLIEKALRAVKLFNVQQLILAGGVSANSSLRARLTKRCEVEKIELHLPSIELCTDNAAMIAAAGYQQFLKGHFFDFSMNVDPNLLLIQGD